MWSLFRAEWDKVVGNRWAAGMLILIFPMATLGITLLAVGAALLSLDYRAFAASVYSGVTWNTRLLDTWVLVNNEFGRGIILGFTAIIFAGEYQNGTWKNLLTRRRRPSLLITKFITIGVFVALSWLAMSLIAWAGTWVVNTLIGVSYGEMPTAETLATFARDYTLQVAITLSSTLIACGYAALAAIVTRNVLGSLLIGFIIMLGETSVLLVLFIINTLFKMPSVMDLYRLTPGYNLANISAWVTKGTGYTLQLAPDYRLTAFSPEGSLLVVALWIVGLLALAVWLFQRQDVTT